SIHLNSGNTMSLKPLLLRTFAVASLAAGLAFAPASQAQVNETYVTIEPAQPSDTAAKIEVLEFFAYTSPHGYTMEPSTAKWPQTLPENAAFKRVPVAFNASMADLQKFYHRLEALDRRDLHAQFFHARHRARKGRYDFKAMSKCVEDEGVAPA